MYVFSKNVILGKRHFLLILFDCLYLNDSCLLRKPLYERKRLLNCVINPIPKYIQLSPYEMINFKEAAAATQLQSLYLDCLTKRQEGLLIKNADSFYIPGNRSEWFKLKKDYIEGFGDTANFAIIGASYGTRSAGVLDTFLVGALNNKNEWENSPSLIVPYFIAVFTVTLGLNYREMDQLQALLQPNITKDSLDLPYECVFGRGFRNQVDFWIRQPLVFELLGSGFVRVSKKHCAPFFNIMLRNVVTGIIRCVFREYIASDESYHLPSASLTPNCKKWPNRRFK
jgi:DNA ligase-4